MLFIYNIFPRFEIEFPQHTHKLSLHATRNRNTFNFVTMKIFKVKPHISF